MYQDKKTIQELNLMDDFLMTESMLHEETAQRVKADNRACHTDESGKSCH